MIKIGPSSDNLYRIQRDGVTIHTCKPGEGLAEATAAAMKLRTPGEQMRRQFFRVRAPAAPSISSRVEASPKAAPAPVDVTPPEGVITDEQIAEMLAGRVADIDDAIRTGGYDAALDAIEATEAAGKDRKGVAEAIADRRDDIAAEA